MVTSGRRERGGRREAFGSGVLIRKDHETRTEGALDHNPAARLRPPPRVDCVTMVTALLLAAGAHAEQGRILLALAFVLVGAKLFGALVERAGQPAVLGELVFGVLLGNLALFGGLSMC